MTERLYYRDSYTREFQARVVDSSLDRLTVYLNRTAFYPTSGGQPHDAGRLNDSEVLEVIDEGDRIAHVLARPLPDSEVSGSIDWPRRFDHMQQHSGQHLLSAVFAEVLGLETVSFHLGDAISTIDIAAPRLDPDGLRRVEEAANAVVCENRPISVSFEDAAGAEGLRKPTSRQGEIRVVTIAGLDRSACGGTHVHFTGEIGPIFLCGLEKIRGNMRVEFLCGGRAVRRAHADFVLLSALSRQFSTSIDELVPAAVLHRERLEEAEKSLRRMASELATERGRRDYEETVPDADGIRRFSKRVSSITEEIRAEAVSFTSRPQGLFLAIAENPPALLLASSEGSGISAGEKLKAILAEVGGRGGGSTAWRRAAFRTPPYSIGLS